jgi:TatD DNase family protein
MSCRLAALQAGFFLMGVAHCWCMSPLRGFVRADGDALGGHEVRFSYICGVYFDIHTHRPRLRPDLFEIESRWLGQPGQPASDQHSIGLHPWYLDGYASLRTRDLLLEAAASPAVWAIGESGMDKMPRWPQADQQAAFEDSIFVAQALQKPLVLHVVRAFSEVTSTLRRTGTRLPSVIFHGFAKHPQLAQDLVSAGAVLSFGEAILHQKNAMESLKNVPATHFFLETDDGDAPIEDLYAQAALLRGMSLPALQSQLEENVRRVFRSFAT